MDGHLVDVLRKMGVSVDVLKPAPPPRVRGMEDLVAEVEGRGVAAIAVPDIYRPVRTEPILDFISGILPRGVEPLVIFATGTHEMGRREAAEMLGKWRDKVRYEVNDCFAPHIEVGRTSRGLTVELDPLFHEADIKITVGVVAPHPWAGYSGGAKTILPGVSSIRTISEHHLHWFLYGRSGVLKNNPFREEIEEAGRLAGVDYSLNIVVDQGNRVVWAAWGGLQESFAECVKVVEDMYVRSIDRLYGTVIVDAAPLDRNLYQATKALEHAALAAEEGGDIILVARCEEGIPSPSFSRYLEMSKEELIELVDRKSTGNIVPILVAYVFKNICEKYSVTIVSPNIGSLEGVNVVRSIDDIHDRVAAGQCLFIQEGGFTVPRPAA